LNEDDFIIIKIKIRLTWQLPIMVSVILPELKYHLHIQSLAQFVIFYDISTGVILGFWKPHELDYCVCAKLID
jgi:hypothetical protein